ncbi:MAG TPA: acyl-CoA dehydrogenase family protein [Thermoplasmata archaeon]|nr:acyl-CoA dehydrogenase family protein [Thermoplasmata archaeon]
MPRPIVPTVVGDAFVAARRPLTTDEERALEKFGRTARDRLEPTGYRIDRASPPRLVAEGTPNDAAPRSVVLAPEHSKALDELYATGMGVGPAGGRIDWPFTFALMHEVADVGLLCSVTVTLATVHSLEKWADGPTRARFLPALLKNGGRAQGATWATERQGGSDLGSNAAVARPAAEGAWSLTGEKFFCSNVGAAYAVVTARPPGAADGVRGLRLFFVPAVTAAGTPNWRVRRLKEKLGTIPVPTGEVEFEGAEAYALGTPEAGPSPILEMLNLSRIANAVGSASVLYRAFERAEEYALERTAFGRPLAEHPLLALDLATLAVESDAASLLAFDAAFRFARTARERPPYSPEAQLTRFSAHVAKLVTAELAVRGTTRAMELLGGIGYLEEHPMARLVRDAHVTTIWEGGANVQALDAREAIDRHHPEARWASDAGRTAADAASIEVRRFLSTRLEELAGERGEVDAKRTLEAWGEVRALTLLAERRLASRNPPRCAARAELYARLHNGRSAATIPLDLVRRALAPPW